MQLIWKKLNCQSGKTRWSFRNLIRCCFLIGQEAVEKGCLQKGQKSFRGTKRREAESYCLESLPGPAAIQRALGHLSHTGK
jgi:hypothetical protein